MRTAEAKVTEAAENLETARDQHAQLIARAAAAGETPAKNAALRTVRLALSDAEDELAAAKAALDRLEADGDDLEASNPQLENAVLVAVSQVIAPVAEQILAQMRQRQAELAILQRVFHVLTEDETIGVPVFHGDVQRLNAKDARMKPVAALRDQLFALDPKAGQDRAKEAAGAWRKWRTALCRDPDAAAPEL